MQLNSKQINEFYYAYIQQNKSAKYEIFKKNILQNFRFSFCRN